MKVPQRQLLAEGLGRIAFQQVIELGRPPPQLRPRLNVTLVLERCLPRPQYLADRVPGHLQIPGNLPDRLALDKVLAPNPAKSSPLSAFPPTTCSNQSKQRIRPDCRGSILDADTPHQGVKIARRITAIS